MKSTNEWDPLKKVIVGVADYARIPEMDKSLRHINYADRQDVSDVISGLYPKQVIDEANEDLENFVKLPKSLWSRSSKNILNQLDITTSVPEILSLFMVKRRLRSDGFESKTI